MGKIQDIGDRVNILMLIHFEHFDQNQSKPFRVKVKMSRSKVEGLGQNDQNEST
jgi:hypothetical protein